MEEKYGDCMGSVRSLSQEIRKGVALARKSKYGAPEERSI
jgi:hypothetical protein